MAPTIVTTIEDEVNVSSYVDDNGLNNWKKHWCTESRSLSWWKWLELPLCAWKCRKTSAPMFAVMPCLLLCQGCDVNAIQLYKMQKRFSNFDLAVDSDIVACYYLVPKILIMLTSISHSIVVLSTSTPTSWNDRRVLYSKLVIDKNKVYHRHTN